MSETNNVSTTSESFKLEDLEKYFEESLITENSDDISLEPYLLGYEELYKFLNLLGTVFGWVSTDVKTKMDILNGYLKDPDLGGKYKTVSSMIDYETKADLIKRRAKDSSTGSRNFLRLHRALEFIYEFLDAMRSLQVSDRTCHISQDAYKRTLEKYHPWVVQKASLLAMHMLPTKEGLITKICGKCEEEDIRWMEDALQRTVDKMKRVYAVTQNIYQRHELENLP